MGPGAPGQGHWGKHKQALSWPASDREKSPPKRPPKGGLLFSDVSPRRALALTRQFGGNQDGGLRGICFKIDEFFRDVFQRILAGLVYSMI